MGIWTEGPVTCNPYRRTVFRIAMLPREATSRAAVVGAVADARDAVSVNPGAHRVDGVAVSLEDVNTAETVLLDPACRAAHELLAHATETASTERVRRLAGDARRLLRAVADRPSPAGMIGPAALASECLYGLVGESFPVVPWLGGLELEPVPPFGREEDE